MIKPIMQMVLSHLPRSIYLNETAETREKLFIYNNLDARIFFLSFLTASFISISIAGVFLKMSTLGETQVYVQRPQKIWHQPLAESDYGNRSDGG